MKRETIRTMILMFFCAGGGVLSGLNATNVSNSLGAALFEAGIVIVAFTITAEALFQTVLKKKK